MMMKFFIQAFHPAWQPSKSRVFRKLCCRWLGHVWNMHYWAVTGEEGCVPHVYCQRCFLVHTAHDAFVAEAP